MQFRDVLRQFGGLDLQRRGFVAWRIPVGKGCENALHARVERFDPDLEFRERGHEGRIAAQRLVRRRKFLKTCQLKALGRYVGIGRPLVAQQEVRVTPAFAFIADAIRNRDPDIIEGDPIERVLTVDRDDRVHLDPRSVHRRTKEGDALLLAGLRARAHEQEDPVSVLRLTRPDLAAVHDVLIILQTCRTLQRRQIGSCLRL